MSTHPAAPDTIRIAVAQLNPTVGDIQGNLAKAREKFRVGNLYLNKGSIGAMVGRQPFGGFNMSGVGSKTGGPDYLLQFMDPRCVTENTIRRGFTPIAEDDDWV